VKLLDTSVAIDFLRRHAPAVDIVSAHVAADDIVASELLRYEVLVGLRRGEEDPTEDLFAQLGWVPVGERIARRAADLARRYRSSHHAIEDADYLIAATALELDADLLTTNVRHFPMFRGLKAAYRLPS
jgi:hypothetical protein